MKKGISVMMSFVIIVALGFIGGNVKAETHATEEEYRVVYSSEPNMNPGYIKALAERQNPQMLMEKSKEGDVQYEASQLVEVREYTDGSIEKDYAVSKLAETTAANTSTAFSQSRGNYSLNLTMYYTVKGTSRNYTYNLTKIQSTVKCF